MKTIHKHVLSLDDQRWFIDTRRGWQLLSAQIQNGKPCLWLLVDEREQPEVVPLIFYGTGWRLADDPGKHLATYQMGIYVWHLFRAPNPTATP